MSQGSTLNDEKVFCPNPEQQVVIEAACDARQLVVAGPGTGKTQVAAMRIVHLMRAGLHPAQVLVLSFSRSAVATLTKRLSSLQFSDQGLVEDIRHLAVKTFDSWAFRVLRQGGTSVQDLLYRSHDANIASVTAMLEENHAETMARLRNVRHVIVDEFQDLPGVRADLVQALLSRLNTNGEHRVGITVLGDPAQAIFRFAARNSDQSLPSDPWQQLKARMGPALREVSLSRNHRATPQLAKMAVSLRKILESDQLDAARKLETMKKFLAGLPAGSVEEKLDPDWLTSIPEGSTAILTRTNGEAVCIWKTLLGDSVGGSTVSIRLRTPGAMPPVPAWIAVLLHGFKNPSISRKVFLFAYAKALKGGDPEHSAAIGLPPVEVAWRRLARASGAPDTTDLIELVDLRARLNWPDSFPDDQDESDARIFITTIHQAKGMEFDNVTLVETKERKGSDSPADPLEEANVGFVALTRAGRQLVRLPSQSIFTPPASRDFKHGRSRQVHWPKPVTKMFNFQIGLSGDVDALSFVDPDFMGGIDAVEATQSDLVRDASDWRGNKVLLRKTDGAARDARYEIRLVLPDGRDRLLGRTSAQVTHDLLDLLWKAGFSLPRTLYNLRIADVVTMCANDELPESVPEPWRSSRLWLGITLAGTGDFKTWKRREK